MRLSVGPLGRSCDRAPDDGSGMNFFQVNHGHEFFEDVAGFTDLALRGEVVNLDGNVSELASRHRAGRSVGQLIEKIAARTA